MNQPRPAFPAWWRARSASPQPPFLELESLISRGLAREAALQSIAARRALTDRGVMADRLPCSPARWRTRDVAHG